MPNQPMTEMDLVRLEQKAQQEQIANDPNALYAEQMREEKITNILSQISPDTLLNEIEHRIRGEKKNEFTKVWEPISKDAPEISEEMVSKFMSFLSSILNQNTTMSNFSPQEINNLMQMVVRYVASDLDVNSEKYGIEGDYTEMTRIGMIIQNTVFTVLKRAQNGMEARRVFGAWKVTENLNQANQKKGIMDTLSFWK